VEKAEAPFRFVEQARSVEPRPRLDRAAVPQGEGGRLALAALFTPGGRPAVLHVVGIADEDALRGAGTVNRLGP
jgi:hypothetical protein